jgi:DNA adenine methylase
MNKPILKWVGGKTQMLDKLDFPENVNNYHELFLGGGSVLLHVLDKINNGTMKVSGRVFAYDANEPLIYVYKNIQTRNDELFTQIQNLVEQFNECGNGLVNRSPSNLLEAQMSRENYFYWIRRRYNQLSTVEKTTTLGSALFMFLNKTCFRGVFRVGPNGFNVPYGHYKNPAIINKEHIDRVHELIRYVQFECCDFTVSMSRVGTGDFVYMDPPYAPEKETSFVGYTENGFDKDQHELLFKMTNDLPNNVKFMMNNADVALVRTNFVTHKIIPIVCRRAINSKHPDAKANELIITNY